MTHRPLQPILIAVALSLSGWLQPVQGVAAESENVTERGSTVEHMPVAPTRGPAIPSPWPSRPSRTTPTYADDGLTQAPTDADSDQRPEGLDAPYVYRDKDKDKDKTGEDFVSVTGGYRLAATITRDNFLINEANGNYNERDFRILSGNQHENTYDPQAYSRLWFDIDTTNDTGWNFHTKLVIDPWSYIGTTDRFTVQSPTGAGDSVTMQLKYWGNTNQIINENFFTQNLGDGFAIPEIEVDNGHTVETQLTSTFGLSYTIPEKDIHYRFNPVRELWTDYTSDTLELRLIAAGYEDQAVNSDDPLGLSNHHIYWEPSPWTNEWKPGIVHNTDFTRGRWHNDLTFNSRDSDLQRLSVLRGARLEWLPTDNFSYLGAIMSPKTLWEEYEVFNRFVSMSRIKYQLTEDMVVGSTYTSKWGYDDRQLDAANHVWGGDLSWQLNDHLVWESQYAASWTQRDRTTDFKYNLRGNAYHTAMKFNSMGMTDMTEMQKEEGDAPNRMSFKMAYTHMDAGFDPGLASYRETRDDLFWGRHISFYKRLTPFRRASVNTSKGYTRIDDIMAFRIGDGVDVNRDVIRAALTTNLFNDRLHSLYDVRNVHSAADGQYIETVVRSEQEWKMTSRLTSKFLYLYHDLPHTRGIDPFVINSGANVFLTSATLTADNSPATMTFSAGADYEFSDYVDAWVIYERSSDIPFGGSDNYPRGLYNDSNFRTFANNHQTIREQTFFLFNNQFFPQPEYPWFDIYRTGMHWKWVDLAEGNITWTRNEYEFAGQIDGNMNHLGFEVALYPTDRLTLIGSYTLSQSNDIARLGDGGHAVYTRHHNMYFQSAYRVTDASELTVQYGVGAVLAPYLVFTVDPTGQYFPVLDTQHVVRLAYTAKF